MQIELSYEFEYKYVCIYIYVYIHIYLHTKHYVFVRLHLYRLVSHICRDKRMYHRNCSVGSQQGGSMLTISLPPHCKLWGQPKKAGLPHSCSLNLVGRPQRARYPLDSVTYLKLQQGFLFTSRFLNERGIGPSGVCLSNSRNHACCPCKSYPFHPPVAKGVLQAHLR